MFGESIAAWCVASTPLGDEFTVLSLLSERICRQGVFDLFFFNQVVSVGKGRFLNHSSKCLLKLYVTCFQNLEGKKWMVLCWANHIPVSVIG